MYIHRPVLVLAVAAMFFVVVVPRAQSESAAPPKDGDAGKSLVKILVAKKEWSGPWSAAPWGGGEVIFTFRMEDGVLKGSKVRSTGSEITTTNVPLSKLEVEGDTVSFETEFGTKYVLAYDPKDGHLKCGRQECVYMGQYGFSVDLSPSS